MSKKSADVLAQRAEKRKIRLAYQAKEKPEQTEKRKAANKAKKERQESREIKSQTLSSEKPLRSRTMKRIIEKQAKKAEALSKLSVEKLQELENRKLARVGKRPSVRVSKSATELIDTLTKKRTAKQNMKKRLETAKQMPRTAGRRYYGMEK